MSSSSSSSSSHSYTALISPRNKYDVFISFRGEDTRDNFTSHLYSALSQKNIETFIDDQLIRGKEISESFLDAIEASSISLVIFSGRYASSRCCLDELVKIIECQSEYHQIVIPIFYGVDPSQVKNQTGSFGDLLSKLQGGPDKIQKWKKALTEAANLSGFHSRNFRLESELIKEVVNSIMKRLAKVFPHDNNNQLVGVESKVGEIESLLASCAGSKNVCTLGIWGIGGIGKTTIARAVFDKISTNFEGSCFLQNVREESKSPGGLACLQQKLVSELLMDETVILDIHLIFRRLSRKKVLIVFDDVTSFNQIESLIGSLDWLLPESQIIITTRNKQVLRNWGVKKIYEVQVLGYDHALEIFSRHAFKQNHPNVGYEEQSDKIINYAGGVPLALKVLGCFLFERDKKAWQSAINKLETILHPNIQEVLKISYDSLDDKEKNIFLDVACFFKGDKVYPVMKFLDASGFYPEIGISVLIDKSLIIISDYDTITMHDLLQEMGREIVRHENMDDPGKRSRLWRHDDIINVLTSKTGTETIEGICLDMSKVKEILLDPHTFTKMSKLRFLKFYSSINNGENKCKVSYFQGPGLAEVRYLHWHGYPLKSFPTNINPEKLVSLEMPHSNIEILWNGVQHLGNRNQRILAAYRKLINKIPKPPLTQHPNKLVILNMSGCENLKSIPAITRLEFLKELDLSDCSKLKRLPEISSGNIEGILLKGTAIEELPSSIECLSKLLYLDLRDCRRLKSLPISLCKMKSLLHIPHSGCINLQRLPDELGILSVLCPKGSAIREVPSSIVRFQGLRKSSFKINRGMSLPISLSLDDLRRPTPISLNDCGITELPESICIVSSVHRLNLSNKNFERKSESIIQHSEFSFFTLRSCERLQSLPKFPHNLRMSDAHHCTALESVSSTLFPTHEYSYETWFDMSDNSKLDGNELRRIVEDTLQIIQIMATARWKQVREKLYPTPRWGNAFLPGNEIPKWFSFQSTGSSVTLKMPPGFSNNREVIGFAVSAIVAFPDHPCSDTKINVFCDFGPCKVESIDDRHGCYGCPWFLGEIVYVESDHLFFGYHFFDRKYNCVPQAFQIYFTELNSSEPLGYCPVKKCGIQLL